MIRLPTNASCVLSNLLLCGGCALSPIDLLTQWLEWLGRKDSFNGKPEKFGNCKSERKAGAVIAALEKSNRLVVHTNGISEILPTDGTLSPQDRDAVVKTAFTRASSFFVSLHDIILRIQNKLVKKENTLSKMVGGERPYSPAIVLVLGGGFAMTTDVSVWC